jgi:hypothetical protein
MPNSAQQTLLGMIAWGKHVVGLVGSMRMPAPAGETCPCTEVVEHLQSPPPLLLLRLCEAGGRRISKGVNRSYAAPLME